MAATGAKSVWPTEGKADRSGPAANTRRLNGRAARPSSTAGGTILRSRSWRRGFDKRKGPCLGRCGAVLRVARGVRASQVVRYGEPGERLLLGGRIDGREHREPDR